MIEFGTGGFRGIIGESFTKENLKLIGDGIGSLIMLDGLYKKVVIGYDFRRNSQDAARTIATCLLNYGITVLLSDNYTPTPAIMYATRNANLDVGIMITASHNPARYNGVKVFEREGIDASVEFTTKLEKLINGPKFPYSALKGRLRKINALTRYIRYVNDFVGLRKSNSVRVLFDALFGSAVLTIPAILGDKLTVLHGERKTTFGGLVPNPVASNLKEARARMLSGDFDLCIATDSDGDRLSILDEHGDFIDANEILAVLYYYLVFYRHERGDIVKNISTSNLIDAVAAKLHFKCHEVDVGFKNISRSMLENRALIGGESSGGLTIRNYLLGKDSTMSTLLFIKMMTDTNKKASELIREVRDFASFHRHMYEDQIDFYRKSEVLSGEKDNVIGSRLKNLTKSLIVNNNIKFYFRDGQWALLRFSGTEPVMRIAAEMNTKADSLSMIAKLKAIVKEIYL